MYYDLIGTLLSLASTFYFIRQNNKAWVFGTLATIINGRLYWQKGIYADMGLECFYFLSMCYGWYQWRGGLTRDGIKNPSTPSGLKRGYGVVLFGVFIILFFFIQYALDEWMHSSIAILDALTTSISLLAQWLMCHKIISTWLLWFVADAIYAFMYLNKGLPFHSILMSVYMGLAIVGYCSWRKLHKNAHTALLQKKKLAYF